MASRIFHLGLVALALIAGAGGYTLRRNLGPQTSQGSDCARHWLSLSSSQCKSIERDDPGFHNEAEELSTQLANQQQVLIDLISDPNTSADQIRTQAQAVLEAHHTLARRIVRHLLTVRHHIDIEQCTILNQLFTKVMHPEDLPSQSQNQDQSQPGQYRRQRGRGGPWWRDQQSSWGRHRYGQLTPALGLTSAQTDPNYESDAAQLTQQVRDAHARLTQTLHDPNTSDAEVQQILEDFLTLHKQLEMRTVDYVLNIRPTLGPEQRQRLIGLSRRGRRWRGGRP